MCCDSYQSDAPGDWTVFHRARFDDQSENRTPVNTSDIPWVMDAPIPDDTDVSDRSLSETPDLAGDLGRKTKSPLSGFGKLNTGNIQCLHVCSRV